MTPEQFCYWLQGRAELDSNPPTPEQWQSIREHLATVFVKVTPPMPRVPVPPPPADYTRTAQAFQPRHTGTGYPDFPPGTIIC